MIALHSGPQLRAEPAARPQQGKTKSSEKQDGPVVPEKERKNDRTTPLLLPGIEQLHSEIVHITDIPGDQRQFVNKCSGGEECIDDRP